jgi:L-lactate dehydrogenase complex protein LldG
MSARPLDSFVSTCESMDVPCEQTTPDDFAETLEASLTGPAVGVALDDSGVSLVDTDVTVDPTPAALKRATTGVTPAAFAIADYGSVLVPSSPEGAELVSLFVDRHVVVLDAADVVPEMDTAVERFGETVRDEVGIESGIVATGPSATADMGALVVGAHGPSEVHVIVVETPDERAEGTDE